jgi:hypothetical protein
MFIRQTHRGSDSFFGQFVILSSGRTLNLNPKPVFTRNITYFSRVYSLIISQMYFYRVDSMIQSLVAPNPFLTSVDHDIVDSTPFIFTLCDSGGMKISIATVLPFFVILASVSIL